MEDILVGVQQKMIFAPTENERKVNGMAENRERSCYTCFHRHACAGMMEAQGLADYVSLGAQSAEPCPDYIYSGDVATVRHERWDSIPNTYICVDSKDCSYHGNATSCSACNEINPNAYKTNYCPNCGAKMDLEMEDA